MSTSGFLCWLRPPLVAAALGIAAGFAHAGLFDDDEARKAILELRQRVDTNRAAADQANARLVALIDDMNKRFADEQKRTADEIQASKRPALELANSIEQIKADVARLRGQNEQIVKDLAEVQRRQKDAIQLLDDRLKRLEPVKVSADGKDFLAEPAEKREFEQALATFRRGDFAAAGQSLLDFVRRYPASGYAAGALFWLANAQYANKDFKEAVINFRDMLKRAPDHPRAAEALLGIANAQIELKDNKAARATFNELVSAFPQSEAAATARDRLSKLRP